MFISEIYESRQGEGRLTGTPSVFVRTSGCNLRCQFCDTPFASWQPEGTTYAIDELVASVESFSADHVVITGGEPMVAKDMVEFTRRLRERNKHITIETAGTVFQPVECDLMSISPKLSNSTPTREKAGDWVERHEKTRINLDATRQLMKLSDIQFKFVVKSHEDLAEIDQFLSRLGGVVPDDVFLMPEGVDTRILAERESWLSPIAQQRGFQMSQRKHIFWYGNRRGT